MRMMKACEARDLTDDHRNEINNKECERFLAQVMDKIHACSLKGKYDCYEPFVGIPSEIVRMISTRLKEYGYEVGIGVGEDGPNRPGHDEIRWNR